MSRVKQLLVPGHTLRHEGAPFLMDKDGKTVRNSGTHGRALCSCGWLSDLLLSTSARQRAHREHKVWVARL